MTIHRPTAVQLPSPSSPNGCGTYPVPVVTTDRIVIVTHISILEGEVVVDVDLAGCAQLGDLLFPIPEGK